MSSYDGTCPHCGEIQAIRSKWEAKDYASDFIFDCDECGRSIEVIVHQLPEFEARKATCPMCHKTETSGGYCAPCLAKLKELRP